MEQEKVIIELANKVYTLRISDFEGQDVDVEECLKIDLNAIIAEMVTFPVFFNRIARLKADVDEYLRQVTFDTKVFEAEAYEDHRKFLLKDGGKATETAIDMAIKRDVRYKAKVTFLYKVQKQADILDGLYWAAKSKDTKLNSISAKIKPEEFEKEILEGALNGVLIKQKEALFKNRTL
jgi:hypothetical protein